MSPEDPSLAATNLRTAPGHAYPGWLPFALAAATMLVAVISGLPSLRGTFVGGDDHRLVLNHVLVSRPSWEHAWMLLTIVHRDLYQPIPLLSFSAEFAMAEHFDLFRTGLEGGAWLFHATNIALHAINTLLVWSLLRRLQNAFAPAAALAVATVGAVVFAAHPFQMEVVAWVNGRMMLLSTLFGVLSLLSLSRWVDGGTRLAALQAVLFATLSAMSKARVELPALMILVTLLERRALPRRLWLAWVPATLITGLITLVNIGATAEAGMFAGATEKLQGSRLARSAISLAWYLRHFVWPAGLGPWYPAPDTVGWLDKATIWSGALLAPWFAAAAWGWRRLREATWALAWFVVSIASTLPLVLPRNILAADRYMYLPSIGLAWFAGIAAQALYARARARVGTRAAAITTGIGGIVVLFAAVATSWRVCSYYDSFLDKTKRIAELFPEHPQTWERMGWAYYNLDEYDNAISAANKALEIGGARIASNVHQITGLSYQRMGRLDEAINELRRAVDADLENPQAYFRLALCLDETGRSREALPLYERTVEIAPSFAPALIRLAANYRQLGRLDDARRLYEQTLRDNPFDVPASLALAELDIGVATAESLAAARDRLERLLAWMPDNAVAHTHLGVTLQALGQTADAIRAYSEALRINPGEVTAMLNLAQLYEGIGRVSSAEELYGALGATSALTVEQALTAHDFFVRAGHPERAASLWQSMLQRSAQTPDVAAMLGWATAMSGRSLVARRILDEIVAPGPVGEAAYAYLALVDGDGNAAIQHARALDAMSASESQDARSRLLRSLELFDSRNPENPWTFILAAQLLVDSDQTEPARASLVLAESYCQEPACTAELARLQASLPPPP